MSNYSKQREEIKKVMDEYRTHPTAEEVYSILKSDHSTASLSTVYRNLHLLSEMGHIRQLTFPDGMVHFDGDTSIHQHAVCTRCGAIFDIAYHADTLADAVLEQTGMHLTDYEIIVGGICRECQSGESSSETQSER